MHVNEESGYIEGLHPIRSKHVVKRLHEFLPIDNTAISVMKMADKADLSILFSHLPEFTMQMPTAVFFFYRPKCAPLLYSRISVCRWIHWTKCGKHFRIIRI